MPHSSSASLTEVKHLLNRACFGARPQELRAAIGQPLEQIVDRLLASPAAVLPAPDWLEDLAQPNFRELRTLPEDERRRYQRESRERQNELGQLWLQQMIEAPDPGAMLQHRMAFFWHGHFATSARKVRLPAPLWQQLAMFQQQATGSFRDLLHGIVRDPAMLIYLDNARSRRGSPNENLARELMELFSLGPGNYTENDIREGARALTGASIEAQGYRFRPFLHDRGSKKILGRQGRFGPTEFVDIILDQPACAEFIAAKLWRHFSGVDADAELRQQLAATLRDADYRLPPLLRRIFLHPDFYRAERVGAQIRSPVQLIVGTARTLQLACSSPLLYTRMLELMGQSPYRPPNVKGWPDGRAWIDTSRLLTRYSFAEIVAAGRLPPELDAQRGNGRMMRQAAGLTISFDAAQLTAAATAATITDELAAVLLPLPPTAAEHDDLVENCSRALRDSRESAIRSTAGQLMQLPQYQLC